MSLTIKKVVKEETPETVCVTSLEIGQTFVTSDLRTHGVRTRDGWATFHSDRFSHQMNCFMDGDEKKYEGLKKVIKKDFHIEIRIEY